MLDDRVASPSEIASELEAPLTHVSYHVRQLAALGLIKLVRTTPRRGAVEHHYTAQIRPKITDDAWGRTPEIVKKNLVSGWIEKVGVEAAERVKKDPDSGFRATTVMMHFEGPSTAAGLPEDAGIRRHRR